MQKTKLPDVQEKGFVYRDSDHSYFFDGKRMTGCTTLLGVLGKPALVPWASRMACDYIREHSAIQHSLDGIPEYLITAEVLEQAVNAYARKRDDGAQKGTDTHALVEEYVKKCIENTNGVPALIPDNESIQPVVDWAQKEDIRFLASEIKLYSKSLWVAGTADIIFEKDGKRYIGDIKTYKKIWDRVPFFQCAGYALMWEEMNPELLNKPDKSFGELKHGIDGYCIINLPKERSFKESEDIRWSFDVGGDTKAFLACVELYRQLASFK